MTFRSKAMSHFRMIIPRESSYNTLEQLIQLHLTHVMDISNPLVKPFFPQIKRCEEALQKVDGMMEALKEGNIQYEEYNEYEENYVEYLQQQWERESKRLGVEKNKLFDYIENDILEHWQSFYDIKLRLEKLKQNRQATLEQIACHQSLKSLFGEGEGGSDISSLKGISTIVGVISPELELKLGKTIYRISRGYACYRTVDQFQYPGLKSNFKGKVVVVIYPNSDTGILARKLLRVMETYCTSVIPYQASQNVNQKAEKEKQQYRQIANLIEMNEKELKGFLLKIKGINFMEYWRTFIWREKSIFQNLNKMELRDHFIVAQIYLPTDAVQKLSQKLGFLSPSPSLQQLPISTPPTAFNTTDYTAIAQQITDTYGVPRYQQVNPAIFTTVTFPFFFGVMFGDMGHGLILFVLGLFLVFKHDYIKKSSMSMFGQLRYMVLMMGFFAFYCGWIYNDFLGLSLNIFGSCYNVPPPLSEVEAQHSKQAAIPPNDDCIYPFGIDPAWGRSNNELVFVNSLKMKISVIIAILHMTVGVIIKAFNSVYFKKKLDLWFEFVPQIIFLVGLFGYMDFLIVFKWLKTWTKDTIEHSPSIISTMMGLGLKLGATDVNGNMWGESQNTSQDTIQLIILLFAVLCIPVMLLPKPIIQIKKINKQKKRQNPLMLSDELEHHSLSRKINQKSDSEEQLGGGQAHDHQDPSEIFVHQLIETIEFVLGAISNTASYLRLWALSLAHSQLARVFFDKTLKTGYELSPLLGVVAMPILFYMLVWVTFGVLMCMDTMECFLHSLRLHWVEFQNKFYKGDGYKYEPISSKVYIQEMKKKSKY